MRKSVRRILTTAALSSVAISLLLGGLMRIPVAEASSHREAPLISQDPLADNTDLYAFVSPDRPNTVTILANFIPFEEPAGGPNFYKFDDNVLYQIRFDNNGDGRLDLAIQFRFRTVVGNPTTFLYNTDTIDNLSDPDWNVKQFMDVTALVRQGDPATPSFSTFVLGTNLPTPPVNVGARSTPNYETNLAEPSISTVPTGAGDIKLFAGQRDDGFYADSGALFDSVGLRPFNPLHTYPLANAEGVNTPPCINIHTIAIRLPLPLITPTGRLPTGPTDPNAVIGIYSTASRPGTRVLNVNGTKTEDTSGCGTATAPQGTAPTATCVQVSRIGNPLFNELFIPMGTSQTVSENDKDLYNAQLPATDVNRIDFIRGTAARPVEPVKLINQFYPSVADAPTSGRNDLVRVYLTGVPGITRFPFQNDPADPTAGPGSAPAEYMRVNVAVPPSSSCSQNRLGVIGGDLAGYPNGRRLLDDVVDITSRIAAGVLLPGNACAGGTVNCNTAPNNQLGDGVNTNDKPFRTTFPYLASPISGYEICRGSAGCETPTPTPTPPCGSPEVSLNTGVADWQVISAPADNMVPRPASIVSALDEDWTSIPDAEWISVDTSAGNCWLQGDYRYDFYFCMCPGFENAKLSLSLVADNGATVRLNGSIIGSTPSPHSFIGPPTDIVTTDQSLFVAGTNRVSVIVTNNELVTGFSAAGMVTVDGGRCGMNAGKGEGGTPERLLKMDVNSRAGANLSRSHARWRLKSAYSVWGGHPFY